MNRTSADLAEALPGATVHGAQDEDQAWIDLTCAGRLPLREMARRDSWGEEFALLDDQHCSVLAEDPTFSPDGDGDAQGDASHKPE